MYNHSDQNILGTSASALLCPIFLPFPYMYLTLEKFDSYDDGVSFNTKVFLTLEHAKAYAIETYNSHLDDLKESEKEEERYEAKIYQENNWLDAPIMYSIDSEDDYYFCIQIQKIPETPEESLLLKHEPHNMELIELSDSNGC